MHQHPSHNSSPSFKVIHFNKESQKKKKKWRDERKRGERNLVDFTSRPGAQNPFLAVEAEEPTAITVAKDPPRTGTTTAEIASAPNDECRSDNECKDDEGNDRVIRHKRPGAVIDGLDKADCRLGAEFRWVADHQRDCLQDRGPRRHDTSTAAGGVPVASILHVVSGIQFSRAM